MTHPFLSIIIPAHDEETRLPRALEQVYAFLNEQPYTSEVMVVENGSQDQTLQVGQEFTKHLPNLRIIHLDESGKGLAIRNGIFTTTGQYRFIADADFSMPVEEINLFLPPACNCDIGIASREAPGSIRYNEPPFRHFTGRVFNFLIRLLVLPVYTIPSAVLNVSGVKQLRIFSVTRVSTAGHSMWKCCKWHICTVGKSKKYPSTGIIFPAAKSISCATRYACSLNC